MEVMEVVGGEAGEFLRNAVGETTTTQILRLGTRSEVSSRTNLRQLFVANDACKHHTLKSIVGLISAIHEGRFLYGRYQTNGSDWQASSPLLDTDNQVQS